MIMKEPSGRTRRVSNGVALLSSEIDIVKGFQRLGTIRHAVIGFPPISGQLACEYYSVVLEDDSSPSERRDAEIGLLRTQNEQ